MAEGRGEPMCVLVTGATGFVGRHLLAHLIEAAREDGTPLQIVATTTPGQKVTITDAEATFDAAGWTGIPTEEIAETVELDIGNAEAVAALIRRVRPQQLYHLAARASGADPDRDAVFAVNVAGTRSLLDAASELTPFPRVLLMSSGYVYGETNPARPAREEDPIGPLWRYGPYTDSKIEMENVAKGYRGFVMVARPFPHTGPGQLPVFAVPAFARQLARMEQGLEPPTLRVGNLEARRDMLDVRDVVQAYRLLMARGVSGTAYNVALGRPVAIGEMLDTLRRLSRLPTEVTTDPARLRPADITCSTGDPSRLYAETGWTPAYSLETTLRDTLDYWRTLTVNAEKA